MDWQKANKNHTEGIYKKRIEKELFIQAGGRMMY
jgi:hypothetical protein